MLGSQPAISSLVLAQRS